MVIIASQHRGDGPFKKDTDYVPEQEWPEDCTVQWGGRGVVLSRKGNYQTAFFEAFPKSRGFFRGEGVTISEAEKNCFDKFARYEVCDHIWGRQSYLNGGTICRKCKAFATTMQPVTQLGSYKAPLSLMELTIAADGDLRPSPYSPPGERGTSKFDRRCYLRMRLAGIDLPETPETPGSSDPFKQDHDDPYIADCRRAICNWYRANYSELQEGKPRSPFAGDFKDYEHRTMLRLIEEDLAHPAPPPPAPV